MGKFREVVLYSLHGNHRLFVVVNGQRLVFHALRGYVHLWQLPYLGKYGVVAGGRLSLGGDNFQLRVKVGEE